VISYSAGWQGCMVHARSKWPPTALLPSICCVFRAEVILCHWWKEEFSPGDAPGWSSAPTPSCCSRGRIHGPTHPHESAPVSLQSSHPQTPQVPLSPFFVPLPLLWYLCSSTTHKMKCSVSDDDGFFVEPIFCPSPKINSALICRQFSFSRPI